MNKNKRFVSIMAGLMAAVMLLTLIVGLIPTRASAQSSSEIRNQINDLKQQKADIDKEIKDFNEELKEVLAPMNNIAGTVMDEYSDEVYHKFTDKLEDKANEIEAENPEKAAQLREVSKSFTEAINLKRIKDILKENPSYANKSYKTARDNWNKFCNEYKSKKII